MGLACRRHVVMFGDHRFNLQLVSDHSRAFLWVVAIFREISISGRFRCKYVIISDQFREILLRNVSAL